MNLMTEICEFGFILSSIYIIFVIINFSFKLYGRFKLGNNTVLKISNWDKWILFISVSYVLTYLF